jgi:hypothetical protein
LLTIINTTRQAILIHGIIISTSGIATPGMAVITMIHSSHHGIVLTMAASMIRGEVLGETHITVRDGLAHSAIIGATPGTMAGA